MDYKDIKIGDYLHVSSGGMNDTNHKSFKILINKNSIILVDSFSKSTAHSEKVAVTKKGEVSYIETYPQSFRHATQEEIIAAGYKPKQVSYEIY